MTPADGPVSPIPLPRAGWKTFVSATWHVALDYPPDWSVEEEATGVTFTSPASVNIQLNLVNTAGLSPEDYLNEHQLPNTRCSSGTNDHDVAVRTCFDTLSRSYSAYFILNASEGPARLLSLTMHWRGDLQVFQAMSASVRP
jgi:hypothetical protein